MRRGFVALICAVLSIVTLSGRLDAAPDPTLARSLVQLDDLPDGFAQSDLGSNTSDSTSDSKTTCGVPDVFNDAPSLSVTYSSGGLFGAYVVSAAARPGTAVAKSWLNALTRAVKAGCPLETQPAEEGSTEPPRVTRTVPLKMGQICDQSVALRTIESGGLATSVDAVLFRCGSKIGVIGVFALAGPAPALPALARKAAMRLRLA